MSSRTNPDAPLCDGCGAPWPGCGIGHRMLCGGCFAKEARDLDLATDAVGFGSDDDTDIPQIGVGFEEDY